VEILKLSEFLAQPDYPPARSIVMATMKVGTRLSLGFGLVLVLLLLVSLLGYST
jgi:hypothetical protein